MRRGNKRKFGREIQARKALLKSLVTALISHGSITTTLARAKTLKVITEKLLTRAKNPSIASRRLLSQSIGTKAVSKLIQTIAPMHTTRSGGCIRVTRLGQRPSDGAEIARIEFVAP